MTTIACNRDVMAADSRLNDTDVISPCQKVWVFPGMLVGTAGASTAAGPALDWFRNGMPANRPDIPKPGSARFLVLNREGIFWCDGALYLEPVKRGFHAIGSGAGPALALMIKGCSPQEAVDITCDVDINSGRPVRVYKLSDAPPARRKQRKV